MRVSRAAWAIALGACAALSCAAPPGGVELTDRTHRGSGESELIPPDPDGGSARETVVGGSVSWERPEVGSISGCTATLVAPEVIITASHCLGYRSASRPGNYGEFTIWGSGGERQTFRIDLYTSFSRTLGEDDVALMRLADPVPSSVATPARLASSDPANGTSMAIWGFGCTRRGSSSDWQKRRYDFLEGSGTDNLCPGDSGGPVMTDDGQVVRINSGYYTGYPGGDIFGEVPRNYDRLVAQLAEWSDWDPESGGGKLPDDDIGGGGGGGDVDPPEAGPGPAPEPERDPCLDYAATCAGCAAISGCGWCASSGSCVSVDGGGAALGECGGEIAADPVGCEPDGDRCGVYGPFPEYTCYSGGMGFVRCRPGGEPETLVCPGPYRCVPGSRELWCYVW